MATAITILANFPCCCDQLCLFWYNIHGDTQTDHGGGEGVETGMRPAGSIPFPVRIQGMSSNGGTGGGQKSRSQFSTPPLGALQASNTAPPSGEQVWARP